MLPLAFGGSLAFVTASVFNSFCGSSSSSVGQVDTRSVVKKYGTAPGLVEAEGGSEGWRMLAFGSGLDARFKEATSLI